VDPAYRQRLAGHAPGDGAAGGGQPAGRLGHRPGCRPSGQCGQYRPAGFRYGSRCRFRQNHYQKTVGSLRGCLPEVPRTWLDVCPPSPFFRVHPMSNEARRFHVAVVGATGAVGQTMLSILAERKFPISTLTLLASSRSAGQQVDFNGEKIIIQDLATFDPSGVEIALFSAGGGISKEFAPKFAAAGAVVIDNSSSFRYDDDVPLVVSEVNPE